LSAAAINFDSTFISFTLSFMNVTQHQKYHSLDMSAPEGKRSLDKKESLDVTDDFDRATSLSHTSRMPLNKNPAQSTTSLPPQHGVFINDNPSQSQVGQEGLPSQAYFESHSQGQPTHTPSTRNSSWDLLGGARKVGQAYEQFDSRNASEQHLAFADGDLPNSKVSEVLARVTRMVLITRGIPPISL
jgi:hypothetical protein